MASNYTYYLIQFYEYLTCSHTLKAYTSSGKKKSKSKPDHKNLKSEEKSFLRKIIYHYLSE